MQITDTAISDVKIITPKVFNDERGFFMETWNQAEFEAQVTQVPCHFVQDNHSKSQQGTLRGLHYQLEQTQGKLIRVVSGEIFDVCVDIRRDSPTFGQWVSVILSADNKQQLWVPAGFAHGFYVTSPEAEIVYKCTDYYHPQSECTILWSDARLAIDWPISPTHSPLLLSKKDKLGQAFAEVSYL